MWLGTGVCLKACPSIEICPVLRALGAHVPAPAVSDPDPYPVFCHLQQRSKVFLCLQGLPGMEVFILMLKPHALYIKIKLTISFPSWKILILSSFSFCWKMYQLMFIPPPWRILYIMTKLWAVRVWEGSQSFLLKPLCFANGTERTLGLQGRTFWLKATKFEWEDICSSLSESSWYLVL